MLLLALPASAALSAALIVVLKPLLIRYALARPNARSSHRVPTPQGGGIAVVAACLAVAWAGLLFAPEPAILAEGQGTVGAMGQGMGGAMGQAALAAAAAVLLACVGAVDDIRPLPAGLRLVLQVLAVALATSGIRLFPGTVPGWVEHSLLVLGGVWFVNLVNFMDGLDWITVAEMVPVTAFLAALGGLGVLPLPAALVAAALCGALLGFAPFNRPVARLFLGDVGSLPIGLLVGWLLLQLAATGAFAAAILLPLYHVADATITLLRRLARGEKVWQAHRSHFYQVATDNGFTPLSVSAHVFCLNLILSALAAATLLWPSWAVQGIGVLAGLLLVGLVLNRFSALRPEVSR